MSKYKKCIPVTEAIKGMESMLEVRRKDTRSKSADIIETMLYAYYQVCEELDHFENGDYGI